MRIKEVKTELFADYFQFYILDEQVHESPADSWTQEAVDRFLAIAKGTIAVGTARNMTVPVTFSIYDSEVELPFDEGAYDQINECDIEVQSGKLIIAGCGEYLPDAIRIEVEKGIYRARIFYSNLDKLSDDGLDGEDFYEIQMWPVIKESDIKIIKQKKPAPDFA